MSEFYIKLSYRRPSIRKLFPNRLNISLNECGNDESFFKNNVKLTGGKVFIFDRRTIKQFEALANFCLIPNRSSNY